MCIPTRTRLTYNDDKPWFTAKLRQLRWAKEDAYRKRDKVLYKQAKYTLEKERVAKRNYTNKLTIQLSSSDLFHCGQVWKTSSVTRHHPPALWRINNRHTIWMSYIADLKKHPTPALNTSPHNHWHLQQPPSPSHLQFRSAKTRSDRASGSRNGKKYQAQTASHQPVWNPVLTRWPPFSQRYSTDHWNCAKSLHASNAPP